MGDNGSGTRCDPIDQMEYRTRGLNSCWFAAVAFVVCGCTSGDRSAEGVVDALRDQSLNVESVLPPDDSRTWWIVCVGGQELQIHEYESERLRLDDLPEDEGLDLAWGHIRWWGSGSVNVAYHTEGQDDLTEALDRIFDEKLGGFGFALDQAPDPIPPDEICL